MKKSKRISLLFQRIRMFIYSVLLCWDEFLGIKNKIVVLCYHSISNNPWKYSVSKSKFEQQINYLLSNYEFINVQDLAQYLNGRREISKPSVLICFDDGYKDIWNVRNFLLEKKIKPLLFLISNPKNVKREELNTKIGFLTDKRVKELKDGGWSFGCHSATHPDFSKITEREIFEEVVESKRVLEKKYNMKFKFFAYPKGNYSDSVLSLVKKAGYKLAFSMDNGFVDKKSDPFKIPRVGVDKTHSFCEFKAAFSPSVIRFRRLVKWTEVWKFI